MISYKQLSAADIFQDCQNKIPYLKDFFKKHPLINPNGFLGNAAFDTIQLYKSLLTGDILNNGRHFEYAYIPLNTRVHLENIDYTINENSIPCCPHPNSFPMKPAKSKSNLRILKFVCSKMQWVYDTSTQKSHRERFCDNPCTNSKCERMVYIYPKKSSC